MPTLVVRDGSLRGQRFEVGAELYVGRDGQQLTVADDEMSRRHAVLRASSEGVTIEDLGSRNGTFVNQRRIDTVTALRPGDEVKLGKTSFLLEGDLVQRASEARAAPDQPFGAYAKGDVGGRRGGPVASRQIVPELLTILAVLATAIALVLYFALR